MEIKTKRGIYNVTEDDNVTVATSVTDSEDYYIFYSFDNPITKGEIIKYINDDFENNQ